MGQKSDSTTLVFLHIIKQAVEQRVDFVLLAGVEARIETLRAELQTLDARHATLTSEAAAQGAELEQIKDVKRKRQCPSCQTWK